VPFLVFGQVPAHEVTGDGDDAGVESRSEVLQSVADDRAPSRGRLSVDVQPKPRLTLVALGLEPVGAGRQVGLNALPQIGDVLVCACDLERPRGIVPAPDVVLHDIRLTGRSAPAQVTRPSRFFESMTNKPPGPITTWSTL